MSGLARKLALPVLAVALMASALGVVSSKQRVRSLQAERQELAGERVELQTEYNQLRLERATIAAPARVEERAHDELDMRDPDDFAVIMVPAHE